MKLSISNIAWASKDDTQVYELMHTYGFTGLDIAPSRIWPDPTIVTKEDVTNFLAILAQQGFQLAGIQSLLYQQPDHTIFHDAVARANTLAALKHMIDLGSWLGASALVFGSPKNRNMGEPTAAKWQIAREFFAELGAYAATQGTCFCLEPNPTLYDSDFLTTTADAFALVREINVSGLRVNVDAGTIIANGEQVEDLLAQNAAHIGHVHLSVPYLKTLEVSEVHRNLVQTLTKIGYNGWVAIEAAKPAEGEAVVAVEAMLKAMQQIAE